MIWRRGLLRTLVGVTALCVFSLVFTYWQLHSRHADATPAAIAATQTDAEVRIESDQFLTLRPTRVAERMGLIMYPGAYVDIRGYVPVFRPIAAAGYRVVIVPMPFELAIYGFNRAFAVQEANKDIDRWVIVGHSVGGAMGAAFASRNRGALEGVIVWDSYPPGITSLSDYPKPVWHIHRARPDGTPPQTFEDQRHLFPANSRWVAIPGGIHMYFGSFEPGGYQEDWAPAISRDAQQSQIVTATLAALKSMEP